MNTTTNKLTITCNFGGGVGPGATDNVAVATITQGNTSTTTMENQQSNPQISVNGKVQVTWTSSNSSYVVTFFGQLNRPNVNDIFSTNLVPGAPSNGIIVAANIV